MISLGIMTFTGVTPYMTKLAEHSAPLGVELSVFSPAELAGIEDDVKGFVYDFVKKEWDERKIPIPPFVYDRCYYNSENAGLKIYSTILKENKNVQFLGHGLPDKWKVYKALQHNDEIQDFLPLTKKLTSITFLLAHFQNYKCWLLKPVKGSQGQGIIKLEELDGQYLVKEVIQPKEQLLTFHHQAPLMDWLHKKIKSTDYLFQPFFRFQTRNNIPFDIRLFLQKNSDGVWIERLKIIRLGQPHHITANLAGGGKMLPFSFLERTLKREQKESFYQQIATIKASLPQALEETCSSLFELAVDIGMDEEDNLWILDINSKPGHKIVKMGSPLLQKEMYEAPAKFCLHLATLKGYRTGVD
ncbi:Endospore coat-associated protein YheD [Bacillus sp. THAF10]|uniref:YheC/YheD family endospore coat-associated protein n=1 Tax=Bacillus sp. THAF10 TaxID=2587848 RepID=UPI001267DCA9|nr:YheC/YheD family protein [Bacillus sp. THAF10]QFT88241.1 Endospore coat-associated protein YheD [Bacillus sp. THAF10]